MKSSNASTKFCMTSIQHLVQMWEKCVDNEGDAGKIVSTM
jgi:hypothetical protein